MTTLSIPLSEDQRRLLSERAIKSGCADSVEYVRRLIEEAIEREDVEEQLAEGLASGTLGNMTDEDWDRIEREMERRVVERATE
jgi:hypothetical protein